MVDGSARSAQAVEEGEELRTLNKGGEMKEAEERCPWEVRRLEVRGEGKLRWICVKVT